MTVSELILETAIKEAGDVCDVRLEKAFAEDLFEILREYNTIHGCLKEKCCICPHCRDCDVDEKGKIKSGQDAQTIGGWISVKDRLPEEHPSMFYKLYGTEKWNRAMWRTESDRVLVTIKFPDGTRTVDKGKLQDGAWRTGVSPVLPQEVTHWALWPEPPREEKP